MSTANEHHQELAEPSSINSAWSLFNWTSFSSIMLRNVEKKILSFLKTSYRGWYVDIGPVVGQADRIWTISLNAESPKTPIVLLHGLGAGVALWVLNLDALATKRPVYAIDILGFGRSSRPNFKCDAMEAEKQLVQSIEEWRKEMKLNEMILLGHSMGGFLATSYALEHPERIKHLILADPWGFPEKPADVAKKYNMPLWVRAIVFAVSPLNPLWAVRAAGPLGHWVVEKTRPDITRKYNSALEDGQLISQYIHQCNAQKPSGESAFHAMMTGLGWAKNPMINRIQDVRPDIPMTFLYGSKSWVDHASGETIKMKRSHSYVEIKVVNGAGHHIYADKAAVFNNFVNDICDQIDNNNQTLERYTTKRSDSIENGLKQIELPESEQDTELESKENRNSIPVNNGVTAK